jgi:hypothetical protein
MPSDRDVPAWLWLGLPPASLALVWLARAQGEDVYRRWAHGESGLVENGTIVVLAIAAVLGVRLLLEGRRGVHELPASWLWLFVAGTLGFAGEEASWGQHWFGWGTPELLFASNEQDETNLHNLSGAGALFDQIPRTALTLAALAAVAAPFLGARLAHWLGSLAWAAPTHVCLPAALGALVIRPLEWLAGACPPRGFELDAGELKELFLAQLLMIWVLSLTIRAQRSCLPARARSRGRMD